MESLRVAWRKGATVSLLIFFMATLKGGPTSLNFFWEFLYA